MIRFLLHGGMTTSKTEKNKKFFQEVVKIGGNRILIFPFSQRHREYAKQFERDKQKFINYNLDKEIMCTMASDDIAILTQQIRDYPSLYFSGGLQDQHLEVLQQIDNVRDLLQDKTVSGTSAGAMIWADSYFSGDYDRVGDGLGYLPIKIMVHWQSEIYTNYNESELEKLRQYKNNLPIYTIREQEYQYFEGW